MERLEIKIIVVGDSGVGKTSLMNVYCNGTYSNKPTIGISYATKEVEINKKPVKMVVWDTAGQERFFTFTSGFFRDVAGVMFVYDVTCGESFNNLDKWFKIVKRWTYSDIPKVVVGNKCDDYHYKEVSSKEGTRLAILNEAQFFETSSKLNAYVDISFESLAQKIVPSNNREQNLVQNPPERVKLTNGQQNNGRITGLSSFCYR